MNTDAVRWPVPFKGRGLSGAFNQNFIWKKGNVWIMDNHRAALWCWLQNLKADEEVGLLHIDQHYDTLWDGMDAWMNSIGSQSIDGMSIQDYLNLTFAPPNSSPSPVFRWDNYLAIFLEKYADRVGPLIMATHGAGTPPKIERSCLEPVPEEIPLNLEYWIDSWSSDRRRWIINVDLDYFFFSDGDNQRREMFSQAYLEALFGTIRKVYARDFIASLTICLTPGELTGGGWAGAEALCEKVCAILDLPFRLP